MPAKEKVKRFVSAVIVNYNGGEYLKGAVESALVQKGVKTEVIVVDNGSTDGSLETLDETEQKLRIIRTGENLGFAKGCNIGAADAKGDYVLFLNPDCVLHKGALVKLVRALERHSDAAIAGPLLLNPDGTEQHGGRRDIPSPWKTFCVLLHLDALMPEHPRFKSFNHAGRELPKRPVNVDAVSGACMLVRSSALARQGGFDEEYFLHFEDLELCMRMGRNKSSILFVPGAECTHYKGQCSLDHPLRVEFHKHNSFAIFMNRGFLNYYPKPFLFFVSLLVYGHFLVVCLKYGISFSRTLQVTDLWKRL